MSSRTAPVASERPGFTGSGGGMPSRRRWRGRVIVAVVLVLIAGGVVAAVSGVFAGGGGSSGPGGNGSATSLVTVGRRTLSTQTQFNGTLGYAGSNTVFAQAHGTVTWLPGAGQVIGDGQVLYRVNGAPVVLLYGAVPAYRALAEGATGADVAQLNHDLVALGMRIPLMWTRPGMSSTGPPARGWRSCRTTSGWTRPASWILGMWCSCRLPRG